jgi:hypothetical protein
VLAGGTSCRYVLSLKIILVSFVVEYIVYLGASDANLKILIITCHIEKNYLLVINNIMWFYGNVVEIWSRNLIEIAREYMES